MDPRIARVIEHMQATITEPISVDDLAASVNLSGSRLAHLFKRDTGMPPARYLHQLRMQRARLLLDRTGLSVKEVMVCVGVRDPSHFARDFRRYHGLPPSAVRLRTPSAEVPEPSVPGPADRHADRP